MPKTKARLGAGSILRRGDGTTPIEVFQSVGQVIDITPPSRTRDRIDATHMESPDDYTESISGYKQAGNVTVSLNFDPSDSMQGLLEADFEQATERNWQVRIGTTGYRFAFRATILEMSPITPRNDRMTQSVVFSPSGKIYRELDA